MSRHQEWDPSCKVYIGGLRSDSNKFDIEDAFRVYGKVLNVWIARKPPGFGFVLMESRRSAEKSITGLNGERVGGYRVSVEISNKREGEQREGRGGREMRKGKEGDRNREKRRDRTRSRSRERRRDCDRTKRRDDKRSRTPDNKRSRSKRTRSIEKRSRSVSKESRVKHEKTRRSVSKDSSRIKQEKTRRSKVKENSAINGVEKEEFAQDEEIMIKEEKQNCVEDNKEASPKHDAKEKAKESSDVNDNELDVSQDSGKDDLDITDVRETFDE